MLEYYITDIEVYGKKDELTKLYKLIKKWVPKTIGDYFNPEYLSNMIKESKVLTRAELKTIPHFGTCRFGYLAGIQFQKDGSLLIRFSSPYNKSMLLMWVKIFDKYLTDYTMYYLSEESGENIYITNNPKYIGTYNFDIKDYDSLEEKLGKGNVPETESYVSKKRIIEILQYLLKSESNDIDELITEFNLSYFVDDISINKFDFVPIEDIL